MKNVTKAYCIINKKTGRISVTEYGTDRNVALDIYPMNKQGEKNALQSFNGYEEVVECEIEIVSKPHKCDCEFCKRKHFTARK